MATNSFLGFSEDGSQLFEMKSKMARQVGDDASDSVKSTIRETLGVPASAEGLTPANNLSDVASAATSRTNLDVMATGDVNDRTMSAQLANALVFDGSSSKLSCENNDLFHFNNGTNDTAFSIVVTGVINDHSVNQTICGVYGNLNSLKEYFFSIKDSKVRMVLQRDANVISRSTDLTVTDYDRKSTTYGMSFSATSATTAAGDDISLYLNGVVQASTATNNASYLGMQNTTQPFEVGTAGGASWLDGSLSRVYVFNRELTAAEHLWLANHPLEVADQWGGADLAVNGGFETWSATNPDKWTLGNNVTVAKETSDVQEGSNAVHLTGGGNITVTSHNWFRPASASCPRDKWVRFRVKVKNVSAGTLDLGTAYYRILSWNGTTVTEDANSGWTGLYTNGEIRKTSATSLASSWYQLEWEANHGESGSDLSFTMGGTGQWLIDDVEIEQLGSVVALLSNNVLESGHWQDASPNRLNGVGTNTTALIPSRATYERSAVDDRANSKSSSNGVDLDGSTSYLSLGDSALLEFGDSVTDTPCGEAAFIEIDSLSSAFHVSSKVTGSAPNNERAFSIETSGKILLKLYDSSTATYIGQTGSTILETGTKYHVAWTYDGGGTSAGIKLYLNGVAETLTTTEAGTYTAMHAGSAVAYLGRNSGNYANGKVHGYLCFNRELSASEVSRLAVTGVPEVADQWGGAVTYTSDFSAGADSFAATASIAVAGNIDSIGGQNNNLRLTCDATTGNHYSVRSSTVTVGQKYRITYDAYLASTNSNVDGWKITDSGATIDSETSPATDAWVSYSAEWVQKNSHSLTFQLLDGGATSFADAGADDVLYFRNIVITPIGSVVALLPTPGSIESDGTWLDSSSNTLNGTPTNVTPLFKQTRLDLDDTNAATGETVLNVGTGFEVEKGGDVKARSIAVVDNSELTISSGAVTITSSLHNIDTEANAATDNLDTMTFSGDIGSLLFIRKNHPSRDIVIKHDTGNIITNTGADVTLNSSDSSVEHVMFIWSGAEWVMIGSNLQGPA